MTFKAKIFIILTNLRKIFFPTNNEIYGVVKSNRPLGIIGKFFMTIYFPSIDANEDKNVTLSRMLNRIILIASIFGILSLCAKILNFRIIEGIFLMFCLTSFFPYIAYIFAKNGKN